MSGNSNLCAAVRQQHESGVGITGVSVRRVAVVGAHRGADTAVCVLCVELLRTVGQAPAEVDTGERASTYPADCVCGAAHDQRSAGAASEPSDLCSGPVLDSGQSWRLPTTHLPSPDGQDERGGDEFVVRHDRADSNLGVCGSRIQLVRDITAAVRGLPLVLQPSDLLGAARKPVHHNGMQHAHFQHGGTILLCRTRDLPQRVQSRTEFARYSHCQLLHCILPQRLQTNNPPRELDAICQHLIRHDLLGHGEERQHETCPLHVRHFHVRESSDL